MTLDPLTPANSTIILADFAVGFANVLRSPGRHRVERNDTST